ncbi:MAG TPA: hypothetical protein VEH56_00505 [Candidatus Saccharimonadales bacterium]|nr:hypothetical protein [Candidatus Saccharimonadales bacterium]
MEQVAEETGVPDNKQPVSLDENPEPCTLIPIPTGPEVGLSDIAAPADV